MATTAMRPRRAIVFTGPQLGDSCDTQTLLLQEEFLGSVGDCYTGSLLRLAPFVHPFANGLLFSVPFY